MVTKNSADSYTWSVLKTFSVHENNSREKKLFQTSGMLNFWARLILTVLENNQKIHTKGSIKNHAQEYQ